MDIRNWFSPINKKKPINDEPKEKKRKKVIESDDDEDPLPSKPQKQKVLASDSDDDIFDVTPKSIKSNNKESKIKAEVPKPTRSLPKPSPSKLKPKTVTDFFGNNPVSHAKKSAKRKNDDSLLDIQSDEAFSKTLQQLDAINNSKKLKNEDHSKQNGNSSSNNTANQDDKKKLASKLSEKMRESKLKYSKEDSTRISNKSPSKMEIKKAPEENRDKTPKKRPEETHRKKPTPKKTSPSKLEVKKSEKKRAKSFKIEITPAKEKALPKKSEELTPDVDELKKQKSLLYRKFLQKTGPKNPGSKVIPEGTPNCLSGMTFVISGELESMDRTEAAELIKRLGGRVTTSVSKLTTYLIVGEEPGVSKTAKAEQLGTKTMDEDGLLSLIETKSSKPSNDSPLSKGKEKKDTSSKLSQFQRNVKVESKISKSSDDDPLQSPATSKSVSSLSSPSSIKSSPSSQSYSQSTEPISSQDLSMRSSETLMFVDKYKPTTLKNIIGQQGEQSNAKKLLNWLKNWFSNQSGKKKLVRPSPWAKDNTGAYFKAALLSGPPGVGKTTTAHIISKELGFDVVELNASNTRSKRALAEEVSELLTNKDLSGYVRESSSESISRRHVLLMDEVDGMAGNEDRGGVQELIGLIKASKVPLICMCNDRNHPKIRSLANYCFDLRFHRPRVEQIRGAMLSVCFREGIKIKPEALDQMIIGSNQDIRQVLHHLSMWSADQKVLDTEVVKKESKMAKKEFKIGPWDVCTKVFSESAHKEMSIHDKVSLFFHDYSIGPLFIQENYLKVSPHCARGNRNKLLEQIAKTAQVLADSDIVDKAIRSQSAWSLLPTQALLSSVCPGKYMEGHFSAQVDFPRWLGNNSKKNKMDRLSQEILTHMRLRISASKQDIITDYSSRLCDAIVEPLSSRGAEGVKDAVDAMISNDLLREDLESILELSTWPGGKDKMANVESKVKAAFTRTLNKESLMTPFSNVTISKKSRAAVDELDLLEEDEDGIDGDEEEEDNDITKDNKIKLGKHSQKKTEATKVGESSKGKGKGKGKAKK